MIKKITTALIAFTVTTEASANWKMRQQQQLIKGRVQMDHRLLQRQIVRQQAQMQMDRNLLQRQIVRQQAQVMRMKERERVLIEQQNILLMGAMQYMQLHQRVIMENPQFGVQLIRGIFVHSFAATNRLPMI